MAIELQKIEQIAIYSDDQGELKSELSKLGITEWVEDIVTAHGFVFGSEETKSVAHLSFNYQLGYEFELLTYLEGDNWHNSRQSDAYLRGDSFLSHKGVHVDNADVIRQQMIDMGINIAQELWTDHHTNPYLIEKKRKFHYIVFDTQHLFGFDYKVIERIEK